MVHAVYSFDNCSWHYRDQVLRQAARADETLAR
jgi:hypothetical protein